MIVWGGSRPVRGERARTFSRRRRLRPANRHLAPPGARPDPGRPFPALEAGVEVDLDAAWTGTDMLVWNGLAGAAYEPGVEQLQMLEATPQGAWWANGHSHHRDGALYSPR